MKKTVYYDAIRGLLAVKPLSRTVDAHGTAIVTVRVTARRVHSGYVRGEVLTGIPAWRVVHALPGQRCRGIDLSTVPVV